MSTLRPHQARAARLKAELDAIGKVESQIAALREMLDRFPELRADFAPELRSLIESIEGDAPDEDEEKEPAEATSAADRQPSVTDRMIRYFHENDNQPASVNDLIEYTRAKESTVRSILYKTDRNEGRFVREDIQGGTHWQLAPQLADRLFVPPMSELSEAG